MGLGIDDMSVEALAEGLDVALHSLACREATPTPRGLRLPRDSVRSKVMALRLPAEGTPRGGGGRGVYAYLRRSVGAARSELSFAHAYSPRMPLTDRALEPTAHLRPQPPIAVTADAGDRDARQDNVVAILGR
jgi:hypothetical protein